LAGCFHGRAPRAIRPVWQPCRFALRRLLDACGARVPVHGNRVGCERSNTPTVLWQEKQETCNLCETRAETPPPLVRRPPCEYVRRRRYGPASHVHNPTRRSNACSHPQEATTHPRPDQRTDARCLPHRAKGQARQFRHPARVREGRAHPPDHSRHRSQGRNHHHRLPGGGKIHGRA